MKIALNIIFYSGSNYKFWSYDRRSLTYCFDLTKSRKGMILRIVNNIRPDT